MSPDDRTPRTPDRRAEALRYHEDGRPGKIQVVATKPTQNQRDLSLAYTPGVAEPCRAIRERPDDAYRYTARGNLVAVVTNGSAVLGLGAIGPLAGKPVMEGKAVLFKQFADLDVFDLEIDAPTAEDVIRFCTMLEPTVGGINLEDIKAPECFEIEETLRQRLAIPVFHDDQHGTAIISGAALLNALELAGKAPGEVRVVFVGAGAAGIATAEHYVRLGVARERITLVDKAGVIHAGRADLDPYQRRFARDDAPRTLGLALEGADVLVGLSTKGAVPAALLRGMARDPVIFALANPDPEILPEEARAVRPDAIVATGRSDYPNQVNNVLGFPFIFRGALDVRARTVTEAMKMAATRALARLAREEVPEAVLRAYDLPALHFGRDYLIPKPLDPRVLLAVAPAVAQAAMESGAARITIDLDEYRDRLEARLSRGRGIMRRLSHRAATTPQRVAFTDAHDARVLRAVRVLADDEVVRPVLVGDRARIEGEAADLELDLAGVEVVDPAASPLAAGYAEQFWRRRQRKGITRGEARARVRQPEYFASLMAGAGDVDAVVMGADKHYPSAITPALEAVGIAPGAALAGIYMMVTQGGVHFFADCTVNIEPDATRLMEIALATATFVEGLGLEPRMALLSFSNFGSARHPLQARVAEAVARLHASHPTLVVDGEMQADTAVVADILRTAFPFSRLPGPANVLIFPDLASANIAYKLLARLGGAQAIGPILVGMAAPIHVLQRGADVDDIVNMAVMAAVDAQERRRRERPRSPA